MSVSVETSQPPQAYSLSFIHALVAKIAPSIEKWLPDAVHASLQDLEKVVNNMAPGPPIGRNYSRGRERYSGYNVGRSNFGSAEMKLSLIHI